MNEAAKAAANPGGRRGNDGCARNADVHAYSYPNGGDANTDVHTHLSPNRDTYNGVHTHLSPNGDIYSSSDQYADSDAVTHCYSTADVYPAFHAYSPADVHPNTNAHSHKHTYAHPNANFDCHTFAHCNTYLDERADGNTDTDGHLYSGSNEYTTAYSDTGAVDCRCGRPSKEKRGSHRWKHRQRIGVRG